MCRLGLFPVLMATIGTLWAPSVAANSVGGALKLYARAITRYPVLTNVIQGGALTGLGDAASQCIEGRAKVAKAKEVGLKKNGIFGFGLKRSKATSVAPEFSMARSRRAAMVGACFNGLILPTYYTAIQAKIPGRDPKSILIKVIVDGSVWGFTGNACLMAILLRLDGVQWPEAIAHAKRQIPTVFKNDLMVWTSFNTALYTFIPKPFQAVTTAVMSSAWAAYISWMSVGKNH